MALKNFHADGPGSLSDVLLIEIERGWSRERITLAATTSPLAEGTVLARQANGTYVPFLKTAGDSDACAVLIQEAPKSTSHQTSVAILRGAVVSAANLQWLPAVTDEQKKTALGQLSALGIVPQEI